jgi:hypothetical protein
MKKLLLTLLIAVSGLVASAQVATNFTCNDCSGNMHDLFSELDAGKVIVLDWVMPCGGCTGPSQTAYNIVQGYQATNPNQVLFYMVDDYANTSCSSLNGWANSIGIPQSSYSLRFVDASINMLDYGSAGMPKVVVLGGASHTVFYNANNSVSGPAIQNAINSALATTGIAEQMPVFNSFNVMPNPADSMTELIFELIKPADVQLELYNLQGKKLSDLYSGRLEKGENTIIIKTAELSAGMYLVKISSGGQSGYANIAVKH